MDVAPLPQLEAAPSQAAPAETSVDAVGSADPVADFRLLLAAGHVEGAIAGMQAMIGDLVSASINERCHILGHQELVGYNQHVAWPIL